MPTAIAAPTQPGTVMGTAGYMSPEQASGQPVDFRSDQFTLGTILYEMATGKRAFQRKTGAETLVAIIREEPEPLSQVAPKAPAPVRWIVERCLAKDPEERYASTKDLARDLKSLRDHLSETSVSGGIEAAEPREGAPPRLAAARRRSRSLLAGIAAAPAARRLARGCGTASQLPAADVPARIDPTGAVRARRPDDRLRSRVGGAPLEIFTTRADSTESRSLGPPRAPTCSPSPRPVSSRSRSIGISSSASRRRGRSPAFRWPAARRARSSRASRTPTGLPTARSSP